MVHAWELARNDSQLVATVLAVLFATFPYDGV